jgi:hypothetical protein
MPLPREKPARLTRKAISERAFSLACVAAMMESVDKKRARSKLNDTDEDLGEDVYAPKSKEYLASLGLTAWLERRFYAGGCVCAMLRMLKPRDWFALSYLHDQPASPRLIYPR